MSNAGYQQQYYGNPSQQAAAYGAAPYYPQQYGAPADGASRPSPAYGGRYPAADPYGGQGGYPQPAPATGGYQQSYGGGGGAGDYGSRGGYGGGVGRGGDSRGFRGGGGGGRGSKYRTVFVDTHWRKDDRRSPPFFYYFHHHLHHSLEKMDYAAPFNTLRVSQEDLVTGKFQLTFDQHLGPALNRLDNPKRTDYTYSKTNSYRSTTLSPTCEFPRLQRPMLAGSLIKFVPSIFSRSAEQSEWFITRIFRKITRIWEIENKRSSAPTFGPQEPAASTNRASAARPSKANARASMSFTAPMLHFDGRIVAVDKLAANTPEMRTDFRRSVASTSDESASASKLAGYALSVRQQNLRSARQPSIFASSSARIASGLSEFGGLVRRGGTQAYRHAVTTLGFAYSFLITIFFAALCLLLLPLKGVYYGSIYSQRKSQRFSAWLRLSVLLFLAHCLSLLHSLYQRCCILLSFASAYCSPVILFGRIKWILLSLCYIIVGLCAWPCCKVISVYQRLKNSVSSSKFPDDGASWTPEQIRGAIAAAIAQYDADKTGLADHALEPAGGIVLSTRCTETYAARSRQASFWGIPLWSKDSSPRTVIQPGVVPGECWSFKGEGHLVVQLSGVVQISKFSYEHIPVDLSPDGHIESAPKQFDVYGLTEEYDPKPILLGSYVYDRTGPPLQTFVVQNIEAPAVPIIEIHVRNNHGHPNYTCLYRVRVHGKRIYPAYGKEKSE